MTGLTLLDGRYRLETSLGGGLTEVYRATDEQVGRPVVVKIARMGLPEREMGRVANEMRLLARLRHPGLVTLYDAGEDDGRPYLVMQYVAGGSLARSLQDGPLSPAFVRRIGVALAEVLAYLHGLGVVHRDLKPGNILLGDDGIYLADLGIAHTLDTARLTEAGSVIGTPAYLSPEQVRGEDVGPGSDLYALGLVLLECLTGRREYSGAPVEAAMARLSRPPVVPDDLPTPWPGLLGGLTAADPADRPAARRVAAVLNDDADLPVAAPAGGRWSGLTALLAATGTAAAATAVIAMAWPSDQAIVPAAPPVSVAEPVAPSPERQPPHDVSTTPSRSVPVPSGSSPQPTTRTTGRNSRSVQPAADPPAGDRSAENQQGGHNEGNKGKKGKPKDDEDD